MEPTFNTAMIYDEWIDRISDNEYDKEGWQDLRREWENFYSIPIKIDFHKDDTFALYHNLRDELLIESYNKTSIMQQSIQLWYTARKKYHMPMIILVNSDLDNPIHNTINSCFNFDIIVYKNKGLNQHYGSLLSSSYTQQQWFCNIIQMVLRDAFNNDHYFTIQKIFVAIFPKLNKHQTPNTHTNTYSVVNSININNHDDDIDESLSSSEEIIFY